MEELSTAVQPSENDELLQEKDAVDLTVVRKKGKITMESLPIIYGLCGKNLLT